MDEYFGKYDEHFLNFRIRTKTPFAGHVSAEQVIQAKRAANDFLRAQGAVHLEHLKGSLFILFPKEAHGRAWVEFTHSVSGWNMGTAVLRSSPDKNDRHGTSEYWLKIIPGDRLKMRNERLGLRQPQSGLTLLYSDYEKLLSSRQKPKPEVARC